MVTFYKVTSWGGMEGRDLVTKYFETEEDARKNALKDTWNSGHHLTRYDVEGEKTIKTVIGKIPNWRESQKKK